MTAHRISPLNIFAIGFGATVGIGWVMLTGVWINQAGPLGAAAAFLVGGLSISIIGLNYAEAARRFPFAGGEMAYVKQFFGSRASYFTGYLLLLMFLSVTAFEGIAVPWLLSELYPQSRTMILYQALGQDVHIFDVAIGILGTLLLIYISRRGADVNGKIQNILIGFFVLASLVFIVAGLLTMNTQNMIPLLSGNNYEQMLDGFLLVLVATPFFYAGFNCIPQAISESDEETLGLLPKLITYSVLASGLFYIGVIFATSGVMQRDILQAHELPVAYAFEVAFTSKLAADIVLFAGLLGLITTWNAMFFACTRLIAAMATSGFMPAFLGKRNQATGAPVPAILMTGLLSASAMFLGRGFVEPVVNTAGVIVSTMFMLVCFGVFKHKSTKTASSKYSAIGLVGFLLASAIFLIALFTQFHNKNYLLPLEWIIMLGWLAIATLLRVVTNNSTRILDSK